MTSITRLSDARAKMSERDNALVQSQIDEEVEQLNQTYALILVGDKALILREYVDEDGNPALGFLLPASWRLFIDKTRFLIDDREVGLGELWLRHPNRRDYEGIVFAPPDYRDGAWSPPCIPDRWYNLWRGYAVDPAKPYADPKDHIRHFRTLYDHILNNVAQGDGKLARYVWAWFAHMIQRPTERIGVGLVLRGKQGTGKTSPGDIIGSLLGEHYVLIDHPEHLVGKFNPHMVKCLLLQADEGFWAGDKVAEGRLKGLLTSGHHMVEKKGVDPVRIKNFIHLLVSSNNAWVVPAGLEERRWAVVDVGTGNMQDRAFFRQMYEEIDSGGRAHLLTWLLRFDLTSVSLNDLPKTSALFEQKIASMSEVQSWWLERLRDGVLLDAHHSWQTEIPCKALYGSYVVYADRLGKGRKLSREQFGMQLGELMPEGFRRNQKVWVEAFDVDPDSGEHVPSRTFDGNRARTRVNGYHIPPLEACREHLCTLIRHRIDWGDDDGPDNGGCSDDVGPDDVGFMA